MLKKVTITGADDSIEPNDLALLSHKYPFVEWGILVCKNGFNRPRFPSEDFIADLVFSKQHGCAHMNLSLHVCGSWVMLILNGKDGFKNDIPLNGWTWFQRVQLNTHGVTHKIGKGGIYTLERISVIENKEFILQQDNSNAQIFEAVKDTNIKYSALFDLSHGAGLLPSEWPELMPGVSCGYAGGLSPLNLKEQIERIEEKAGDTPIWIDMETHVRSNLDNDFDLEKVERCLEIAKPYIR